MLPEEHGARVKRFLAGPGVVMAAIVGGSVIVFGLFHLLSISGLFRTDVSARQGETVQVDGGTLTALRWCAFVECPNGGDGEVRIWVKACANDDSWLIDQADFYATGVRGRTGARVLRARPAGLGRRTLDARDCAEGFTAFRLGESPASITYFGHGYSVLWELTGTARIPLTGAILGRVSADERGWLVQFETFYRRATAILSRDPTRWLVDTGLGAGSTWSYFPDSLTPRALNRLASLGDCNRALSNARNPVRFRAARKIAERACTRFRTAATHFRKAFAVSPDAAPVAGTDQELEFTDAFDEGIDAAWLGLHALVRAHDRALVVLSSAR